MRHGMMNSGPATGSVSVLFSCSSLVDDRRSRMAGAVQRGEDG